MDGAAAIRALRRMNATLPNIAASGLSANHAVLEAMDLNIHGFITKPYTAEKLLEQLQTSLARVPARRCAQPSLP